MFGLFDWLKMGAAALVSGAAVWAAAAIYDQTVDDPAVRRAERQAVLSEARDRALALIQQRNEDNAEISDLDMAGLCRELGGLWVPEHDTCR